MNISTGRAVRVGKFGSLRRVGMYGDGEARR